MLSVGLRCVVLVSPSMTSCHIIHCAGPHCDGVQWRNSGWQWKSHARTHTYAHARTHTQTYTLSHTHTQSLSLTHTHTHILTHCLGRTHALLLCNLASIKVTLNFCEYKQLDYLFLDLFIYFHKSESSRQCQDFNWIGHFKHLPLTSTTMPNFLFMKHSSCIVDISK